MDDEIRNAILDLAVEDYYGLWELLWRARTLWPDAGDDLDAAVREQTRGMLDDGLIELVELSDGKPRTTLSTPAARAAADDDANWDPESGTRVRASATAKGESAYQGSS